MVEAQFAGFRYLAEFDGPDAPRMFPQEEVYQKLLQNKVTLEDPQ